MLFGPWSPTKAAHLFGTTLRFTGLVPCAGELSTVNPIGTQVRDPINLGLTRWRMALQEINGGRGGTCGRNPVLLLVKYQIQPKYGDEQADAGQDCRTRLARPKSYQAREGTGNTSFPYSADHEKDWQPYPVDPYPLAICDDHKSSVGTFSGSLILFFLCLILG